MSASLSMPHKHCLIIAVQRRPPPTAPQDLERVINGELKGEDLNKYNAQVTRTWTSKTPRYTCKYNYKYKNKELNNYKALNKYTVHVQVQGPD